MLSEAAAVTETQATVVARQEVAVIGREHWHGTVTVNIELRQRLQERRRDRSV